MALKTFTNDRAPAVGDGKRLASVHLAATAAAVVELCDGTAATPLIQFQIPINTSKEVVYSQPMPVFPNGLHVELVSGTLGRGCVDLV